MILFSGLNPFEDVLLDTIKSCFCIMGRSSINGEEYPAYADGITWIHGHIFSGTFNGEWTGVRAASVLYICRPLFSLGWRWIYLLRMKTRNLVLSTKWSIFREYNIYRRLIQMHTGNDHIQFSTDGAGGCLKSEREEHFETENGFPGYRQGDRYPCCRHVTYGTAHPWDRHTGLFAVRLWHAVFPVYEWL